MSSLSLKCWVSARRATAQAGFSCHPHESAGGPALPVVRGGLATWVAPSVRVLFPAQPSWAMVRSRAPVCSHRRVHANLST